MKKLCLMVVLCSSVSTMALGQILPVVQAKTSSANQVIQMVERNVMSRDVEYKGRPTIKPITNGFEVAVPAGVSRLDKNKVIPSFAFPLTEDGAVNGDKRYQFHLDKLAQVFPLLESTFKEKKVTLQNISYIGKYIPALEFVESQVITLNGVRAPMEANGTSFAAAEQIRFTDSASLLKNDRVKQENGLLLIGFELSHPLAKLTVQSFEASVSVPETGKAKSPMEQVLNTPAMQQKMSWNNVVLTSPLAQDLSLSFNLTQQLDVQQNPNNFNMNVDLAMAVQDIKTPFSPKVPTNIKANVNATGFTFQQFLTYSAAQDKITESEALPASPRKDALMKSLEQEADRAYDALIKNMVVTLNEVTATASDYAAVLKGTLTPKNEKFKGTLQVTNFAYLAPEPKKIDEAACKAVMDKMMAGSLQGDAFRSAYDTTCDEGRGPLDFLRPYAAKATPVKDAAGKDALLFAIDAQGDDLFVNGQKIDDDQLPVPNPMSLMEK